MAFKYLDDDALAADVVKVYATLAQGRAKVAYHQHCPIGEQLAAGESATVEYKSTLRTGAQTGEVIKSPETACLKTIAAFAISREGGTLLIGVADDGTVRGLQSDCASLRKTGKDDRDAFLLHLNHLLVNASLSTSASATARGKSATRRSGKSTSP